MTEPKQSGIKKGFLFGSRIGEQNKTYTLSLMHVVQPKRL